MILHLSDLKTNTNKKEKKMCAIKHDFSQCAACRVSVSSSLSLFRKMKKKRRKTTIDSKACTRAAHIAVRFTCAVHQLRLPRDNVRVLHVSFRSCCFSEPLCARYPDPSDSGDTFFFIVTFYRHLNGSSTCVNGSRPISRIVCVNVCVRSTLCSRGESDQMRDNDMRRGSL